MFNSNFLFPFIIALVMVTLFACTDSTETKKASLFGKISLENDSGNPENEPIDFSGITVALYDLAYLDTTVVRINTEYPHIGIQINQHTEFDHRTQEAVYIAETNSEGDFKIKNITPGTYNFVAMKNDWGWRYVYEISLSDGDYSLGNVMEQSILNHHTVETKKSIPVSPEHNVKSYAFNSTIDRCDFSLFPELHLSGAIDSEIIIEPFHHLVCDGDIQFLVDSNFTLKKNAVCRITENSVIEIYGYVKIQGAKGSFASFTSEQLDSGQLPLYSSIKVMSDATVYENNISWVKLNNASQLLTVFTSLLQIENVLGKNYKLNGILCSSSENIMTLNGLFRGTYMDNSSGIEFDYVVDGEIKNCVFINNYKGMSIKNGFTGNIRNNLFEYNNIGSELLYFLSEFKNNELKNNSSCDLKFSSNFVPDPSNPPIVISNNIFLSSLGVYHYSYPYYRHDSGIIITNNNFYCADYFIKYFSRWLSFDIDAKNNFFDVNTENEIYGKVLDEYSVQVVDISLLPYYQMKINDIGIQ